MTRGIFIIPPMVFVLPLVIIALAIVGSAIVSCRWRRCAFGASMAIAMATMALHWPL
jgi:hypothetical protein